MSKILLIEDDIDVGGFVSRGMKAEGYEVATVLTANSGLAYLQEHQVDIVVLDLMLPDMSGKEACRILREQGNTTPILMLTALDATEDKIDGLKSGADDYVVKPFDFDELLARVEVLLRRAQYPLQTAQTSVQVGEVWLDRETMTAKLAGELVELTSKEFELADMLFRSLGKVVSRSHILNKIWGLHSDPLTNVVDVYILHLRQKLKLDAETGLIRTVRGYGYKVVGPDQ